MRILTCLLAATLIILPAATHAQAPPRPDPRQTSIVYTADGMDRARLESGRTFRSGGTELAYDVYAPAEPGADRPAVVFVSGAEQNRNWKWFQDYGRLAAAHGFVGVIPDKRYPRGFEGTRSGNADTEAVVAHLIDNSQALGIDPKSICLWTFSAGGRISSLSYRASAPDIRCLVAYYGVMDASGQVPQDAPNRTELVTRYSPVHAVAHAEARRIPTLIVRAGKDQASLNAGIDAFVDAAVSANQPLTFINYPAGDHGFDGLNDTDESRRIMKESFRFLEAATK